MDAANAIKLYESISSKVTGVIDVTRASPVMVGRAPKFLGALKVVPKLVASGSGKKTGRGKKTT